MHEVKIIDKIFNAVLEIRYGDDLVLSHPANPVKRRLGDYKIDGYRLATVILELDGSWLLLYKEERGNE